MKNIQPGQLFTITWKEGSRPHSIGDRSYTTDIFICDSAEQVNPETFIVAGTKLYKEAGNILRLPDKWSLNYHLAQFLTNEANIYIYDGVYKLVEEVEQDENN